MRLSKIEKACQSGNKSQSPLPITYCTYPKGTIRLPGINTRTETELELHHSTHYHNCSMCSVPFLLSFIYCLHSVKFSCVHSASNYTDIGQSDIWYLWDIPMILSLSCFECSFRSPIQANRSWLIWFFQKIPCGHMNTTILQIKSDPGYW
jgi:hypothetical protein